MPNDFRIERASDRHVGHAETICAAMEESAIARGTGIGTRTPQQIREKMRAGKAIIATDASGEWAGFCYLEAWENETFVSNSGLIVAPRFRMRGLAERLKQRLFRLCRKLFPQAKLFGITTSQAVMNLNTKLGFKPVAFGALPKDPTFWAGCAACRNHDILARTNGTYCLCTGMVFEPKKKVLKETTEVGEAERGGATG
ncbi:MAG: GNAT family N-acetyltransferase [Sphingobacteriaceae bacterium]|nr:GNAT family N-acetyltransferase [Cytophagaceae bacterium]